LYIHNETPINIAVGKTSNGELFVRITPADDSRGEIVSLLGSRAIRIEGRLSYSRIAFCPLDVQERRRLSDIAESLDESIR
jgi:hypothetical protein